MKNLFKIIIVTFVIFLLPLTCLGASNVVTDGTKLICRDANDNIIEPFVHEGTTYVPIRTVAEYFKVKISWDSETMTVYLGEEAGSPELNDYINVFYNGQEFICSDANGNRVYPILKEGITYIPLRSISMLFGKNIYWDSFNETAVIITPPSEHSLSYFYDSLSNTSSVTGLKVQSNIRGDIYINGEIFDSISQNATEDYSPTGFSLSEFLPQNYSSNISYLGDGNYFIVVPSDRFSSNPDLVKTFFNRKMTPKFSPLYIYISTKGSYITNIKIYFNLDILYNGFIFRECFAIESSLKYPDSFSFPPIPYPNYNHLEEGESYVEPDLNPTSDFSLLTNIVNIYTESLIHSEPNKIFQLLYKDDYKEFFSKRSSAQINVDVSNIKKQLSAKYNNARGYAVDYLIYLPSDSSKFDAYAKVAVSITIGEEGNTHTEEKIILLCKKDGKWYIDASIVQDLYNLI